MKKQLLWVLLSSMFFTGGASAANGESINSGLDSMGKIAQDTLNDSAYMNKIIGLHLQHIEGAITAPTCTVSFPGDVDFGAVSLAELNTAASGSVIRTQGANIELTGCAPGVHHQYRIRALGDKDFSGQDHSSFYKEDGGKFNGIRLAMKNSQNVGVFTDGSLRGLVNTDHTGTAIVPVNIRLEKDNSSGPVDTGKFHTGVLYIISQQ
ncbi:fimbrial protein [Enterobacter hormaechei]|uniref:fimbrial protein n=1 Tax=Enterobacter hormaechei TaxID=158836 RepID=UPI000F83AD30|nr:fimbrial protein [Enterobacter hormaechei]RTO30632.1 hypothetical protein EKN67_21670 [Enterobacter hormaechei]